MFGIGFQEMLIILVVVLIFFGPKRLPDLAKSLGKGIAEFKKASDEVRKGIEDAVKEETAAGTTKPEEDLSAYGRAPGSAPAPSVSAKAESGSAPDGSSQGTGTTESAPPAPEVAAPETPVPPLRQG